MSWAPQVTKPRPPHEAAMPQHEVSGHCCGGDGLEVPCGFRSVPRADVRGIATPSVRGGMVTENLGGRSHTQWHDQGLPGRPPPCPHHRPVFVQEKLTSIKRPFIPRCAHPLCVGGAACPAAARERWPGRAAPVSDRSDQQPACQAGPAPHVPAAAACPGRTRGLGVSSPRWWTPGGFGRGRS